MLSLESDINHICFTHYFSSLFCLHPYPPGAVLTNRTATSVLGNAKQQPYYNLVLMFNGTVS